MSNQISVFKQSEDEETPGRFPLTTGRTRGYHPLAVDAFLAAARASFEDLDGSVRSSDVRVASFPLARRGYRVGDVDAALGRLEDEFALRERETSIAAEGVEPWITEARASAQMLLDHLSRRARRRFARTSWLTFGYRVDEVDRVADRIAEYLRDGDLITAAQVRSAAFRMQRRGYREEQVDELLDDTVRVILAVS